MLLKVILSNLNTTSLFSLRCYFTGSWEGRKEKLPIKIDEESSLVDKRFEISNLILIRDIVELVELVGVL